jgi:hypothetical protein
MSDDKEQLEVGSVVRWFDDNLKTMVYARIDKFEFAENGTSVVFAIGLGRSAGLRFKIKSEDFDLRVAPEPRRSPPDPPIRQPSAKRRYLPSRMSFSGVKRTQNARYEHFRP